MNGCELKKCRFWDGEKCNDKNDWISAENGEHCCGLRSDAVLVEKEKRKLLADGTLPLTDEEKAEFCKLFMKNRNIKRIYLENGLVYVSLKPDVIKSVCDCGKPMDSRYAPCCSLNCWSKKFE